MINILGFLVKLLWPEFSKSRKIREFFNKQNRYFHTHSSVHPKENILRDPSKINGQKVLTLNKIEINMFLIPYF
jgi:hypothetical protein